MSTTTAPAGTSPATRWTTLAAAVVVALAAALSGLQVGEGNKLLVVVPLALCAIGMLATLAMTRFSAFIVLVLVVRASIDIAKLSGRSAGNTATNTVASRGADPSSLLAVLLLVAATLWLAGRYLDRTALQGSAVRTTLLLFVGAGFLSLIGSHDRTASLLECLRVLAVVIMFAVLEQLMSDRASIRRYLLAAYLSLAFPLLYTVFGYATGSPPTETKGTFARVMGPFTQSNTFGRYLMVLLVMGVALYPHLQRRGRRVLAVALGLSGIFLLLTYTRTALLGTVIGLVVVGAYQSKRVLALLAVGALCGLMLVPQLGSRFTDLASTSGPTANAPTGNSLEWRLGYWTEVLPLANRNPVTGIGLNMTQYETDAAKQPHNDFIRAYVETGVVGLLAYIAMLWCLVSAGRRAVRATVRGTFERGVAAGALGCAVAFVAVSAAANVMSNVVTLWYLVTFIAAAIAVTRLTPSLPGAPAPGPSIVRQSRLGEARETR